MNALQKSFKKKLEKEGKPLKKEKPIKK